MMMILGLFIFELRTAPYQQLNQENTWRHSKADRVGASPRYQYIGPGEETLTINGVLYPEITGGDISLAALRAMGFSGRAWPLIEGTGLMFGMYVITSLKQTREVFFRDGKAMRIEFTLSLTKVSESLLEDVDDYSARGKKLLSDATGGLL
ncbi:phage tail protein [Enterobacter asburiae]|uniref:phage tail protein n=1 Tax=Enterobacter asburiae TaxID=61645 RepID=UPI003BE5B80B